MSAEPDEHLALWRRWLCGADDEGGFMKHLIYRTAVVFAINAIAVCPPAAAQMSIVDLGTLPGGNYSAALDINDHGQVVGVSNNASGEYRAFQWDRGQMMELPLLPGAAQGAAIKINNRGQIIGTSDSPSGFHHAVLWENGIVTDLGMLPDFGPINPTSVNEHLQVVGRPSSRPPALLTRSSGRTVS
jgi:probable HAF family extracellular repeat protein